MDDKTNTKIKNIFLNSNTIAFTFPLSKRVNLQKQLLFKTNSKANFIALILTFIKQMELL